MTKVEQTKERLRTGIIEGICKKNEEILKTKYDQIKLLENEIVKFKAAELSLKDLAQEIKTITNMVKEFSISSSLITTTDSLSNRKLFILLIWVLGSNPLGVNCKGLIIGSKYV